MDAEIALLKTEKFVVLEINRGLSPIIPPIISYYLSPIIPCGLSPIIVWNNRSFDVNFFHKPFSRLWRNVAKFCWSVELDIF